MFGLLQDMPCKDDQLDRQTSPGPHGGVKLTRLSPPRHSRNHRRSCVATVPGVPNWTSRNVCSLWAVQENGYINIPEYSPRVTRSHWRGRLLRMQDVATLWQSPLLCRSEKTDPCWLSNQLFNDNIIHYEPSNACRISWKSTSSLWIYVKICENKYLHSFPSILLYHCKRFQLFQHTTDGFAQAFFGLWNQGRKRHAFAGIGVLFSSQHLSHWKYPRETKIMWDVCIYGNLFQRAHAKITSSI